MDNVPSKDINVMSDILFTKMHGLGNDYIYIDMVQDCLSHNRSLLDLDSETWCAFVRNISDRHTGIGSDGVVLLMPSETSDFRMRIFNADGSEAQMCGNASRCIGKYVYERGLTSKENVCLETLAGIKNLHLYVRDCKVERVCVDMGIPKDIREISISTHANVFDIVAVDMGNPHAVLFVEDVQAAPVALMGPIVECAKEFASRTNVEFVTIESSSSLRMRVWERGSGETMACGTGACAAAVAAMYRGQQDRSTTVHLRGGDLDILWRSDDHVLMTGEANYVFDGIISIE